MKIDFQILLDKIYDRLSEQDGIIFDKWLNADDRHKTYFEKLKQRELDVDSNTIELTQEQQGVYRNSFLSKIKTLKKKEANKRYRILYAASVAAITFFVVFNIFSSKENPDATVGSTSLQEMGNTTETEQETHLSENKVKVSNKKVQLITAQGQIISLMDIDTEKDEATQPYHLSDDKMSMVYSTNKTNKEHGLNSLLVYKGAEFKITLNDGSKVHLNADSKLEYPTVFNDKERRVYLQGEAFFEVAKDASKPFIVCVGSTEIKVLGTVFNINSRKPESVKTTLVSGSVIVKSTKTKETILKPGYTAIVNQKTGALDINDKDIQCYIGWKTGNYLFESSRLSDILEELAIWYDLSIDYQTDIPYNETFTGSLSRSLPIDKLIQIIEKTNYLSLKLKNKTLVVKSRDADITADH